MNTYTPDNQRILYPCVTIVALQFLSNFIRNKNNLQGYCTTHNREQSEQNGRKIFSFFFLNIKYRMFPACVASYKLLQTTKAAETLHIINLYF